MKTTKEMVEDHFPSLDPVGQTVTCPKCGDGCPPNTGLITISNDDGDDVFKGCYICLDNEVKDHPLAHGILQAMFAMAEHTAKINKHILWLKYALVKGRCTGIPKLDPVPNRTCECPFHMLARDEFAEWCERAAENLRAEDEAADLGG